MVILCMYVHSTFSLCVCELFFTDLLNFGWNFESAHEGIRFLWSEDFKLLKECVAESVIQYNWLDILYCEDIFPFVEAPCVAMFYLQKHPTSKKSIVGSFSCKRKIACQCFQVN